ncbi:MAG: hypothetical protein AAF211_09335 [Myxococcota bacterium]
MSHAGFLRDHHDGPTEDVVGLVRALADAGEAAAELPLRDGVSLVQARIDTALEGSSLAEHRTLLHYVARLALAPRTMRAVHLAPLRADGYADRELHDVANVVCCFSYMNRLADGLGVTSDYPPGSWAEQLLGAERLAAHRAWATEGRPDG